MAISRSTAVWRRAVLLAMAVAYGEACDRIERLNRYLAADGVTVNQNSVICFAGVLLLQSTGRA